MRKKSERKLLSVINSSGNIKARVIVQARNAGPVGRIMSDTGSGLKISGRSFLRRPDINDRCRIEAFPRFRRQSFLMIDRLELISGLDEI